MAADQITSRMMELVDRQDILDVVTRYAAAVDTRDWPLLATLFTDDARFECVGLGESEGPEGIAKLIGAVVEPLDATQHVTTNDLVVLNGDEAEHTAYFLAQHVRRELPDGEQFLLAGRYDDRLRRTTHGWRFTRRLVTIVWSQGNPAVVAG